MSKGPACRGLSISEPALNVAVQATLELSGRYTAICPHDDHRAIPPAAGSKCPLPKDIWLDRHTTGALSYQHIDIRCHVRIDKHIHVAWVHVSTVNLTEGRAQRIVGPDDARGTLDIFDWNVVGGKPVYCVLPNL